MLNISNNRVNQDIEAKGFTAFKRLEEPERKRRAPKLFAYSLLIFLLLLFLPWTQNVRGKGYVTTRLPENRPQSVPALIDARVVDWFVREGLPVEKGDTLVQLAEVKDEYLDPDFVQRAAEQLEAKREGMEAYRQKIAQLEKQLDALEATRLLKIQQAENYIQQARLKIQADSIELAAAQTNLTIADRQYERMETLFEQGLKSRKDLEDRRLKQQETQAKIIKAETDYLASQNKLLNEQAELQSQQAQYREKLAKTRSDIAEAYSALRAAQGDVAKLRNQVTNYRQRQEFYFVTAPQSGYITKTTIAGIGETVKAGQELLTIVPVIYDLAVEMYIDPLDLPLIRAGQHIRLVFDGWPAIVFSGWPDASYGTYGGQVIGIDNVVSENGQYRVLIGPAEDEENWPEALRLGAGAKAMALLQDVPLGYELWRRINGFPPDFYQRTSAKADNEKKK